ncbi:MAG: hypothetical protein H6641_17100 [Caldilineaceae bacterium]|nr:hypothetical protein [Caldilineaceae bacterium]
MMSDDGQPSEGRLMPMGESVFLWEVASHTLLLKMLDKEIWIEAIYQGGIDDLRNRI